MQRHLEPGREAVRAAHTTAPPENEKNDRKNEDAAKALGINVFVEKVKVMLISGAIGGIGGCFFAQYFLYIDPLIVFGVV